MMVRCRYAGLTLIELLVSMAILASIVTLTAAIWAQASAWADEATGHVQAPHVTRVGMLVAEQWESRRLHARLDSSDGPAFVLVDDRLEFVTGAATLFADAGLVRVRYSVRDAEAEGEGFDLLYDETPLTDPVVSILPVASNATENLIRSVVLLPNCESLRWERLLEETEEVDGQASRTTRLWDGGRAMRDDSDELAPSTQREVAYRLTGEIDGRRFTWVLVGADLR